MRLLVSVSINSYRLEFDEGELFMIMVTIMITYFVQDFEIEILVTRIIQNNLPIIK